LEIADRRLRAVLVPRLEVFTLDSGTSAEAARIVLATSGHSRAPVVRNGMLDDTVGVIHLRDLVGVPDDRPVDTVARPPMLLPESLPVVDALRQFKASTSAARSTGSSRWRTSWRRSSERSTTRPTATCRRYEPSRTGHCWCPGRSPFTT
jgi:hypothetical protein